MTTTRQGVEKMRMAWQSLAVQITLSILVIVLMGIGGFSWFEARMLHRNMQREMGAQQASVAAYMGGNVDREVGLRLAALRHLAAKIPANTLRNPAALQLLLAQLPLLQSMFNGGAFVVGLQGDTLAAHSDGPVRAPLSAGDTSQLLALIQSGQKEGVFLADAGNILLATPVYASGPRPVGAGLRVGSTRWQTHAAAAQWCLLFCGGHGWPAGQPAPAFGGCIVSLGGQMRGSQCAGGHHDRHGR